MGAATGPFIELWPLLGGDRRGRNGPLVAPRVPRKRSPDVVLRGLSLVCDDHQIVDISHTIFEGLYEHRRRAVMHGKP